MLFLRELEWTRGGATRSHEINLIMNFIVCLIEKLIQEKKASETVVKL